MSPHTDRSASAVRDTGNDLSEGRLASEVVYEGAFLTVRRDTVTAPDGTESVREWIEHPGASAVVPLFEDGSILLIRQFRYPPQRTYLELPAGKRDKKGEDFEEVARRELEEETGWRGTSFAYLGVQDMGIGYTDEAIHYYLAEGLEQGTYAPEAGEAMEPVRVGFEEALAWAREGQLRDVKTTAGLMLAARLLEERGRELQGKKLR